VANDDIAFLQQHDDPVRWEYPEGFDYSAAVSRFREFVAKINRVLGTRFKTETESHIQDASFHSQVDLGGVWLRFSNFGDMVAVTDDSFADPDTLRIVRAHLSDHCYRFMPNSVLDQPYTGSNLGVTGIDTWWIRYFDWV
jgi:hypothetical protein